MDRVRTAAVRFIGAVAMGVVGIGSAVLPLGPAAGQPATPAWSNTSAYPSGSVAPYYPPAPATWTSAAPTPAQQQRQPVQDLRPWMLTHRIASSNGARTSTAPQAVQPYYGTAPVLVTAPGHGAVPEWPAQLPAPLPVGTNPVLPMQVTAPIMVQQSAQASPGAPTARPLKEGQGIGAGPYWARGLGLYVTGWLNGAIPTINEITNESTGNFAQGILSEDSANDGVIFAPGIAIGVALQRYGFPVRAELEYTARSKIEYGEPPFFTNDPTGSTVATVTKNQTLMVNTYIDLYREGKSIQPYLGFGLGASWNKSDTTVSSQGNTVKSANNENEFAWSMIAGFGYRFSDAWLIDTRYRWANYGAARFGPSTVGANGDLDIQARDISAHELGIGLRYHF